MKKNHRIAVCVASVLALTLGTAGVLAGCGAAPLTDEPLDAKVIADYTKAGEHSETFASGSKGYGWENGSPFNAWWDASCVSYEGNKLSLSIKEMTSKPASDCKAEYLSGEERSEHYYGFGDFEVKMKPAAVVGTASTFFTCTGDYDKWYNSDGEVVKENKHDEIDIEFLGKDTTGVQFNYFANGKGGHEHWHELGFDASKGFHTYGYRWTDSYITWFVDGEPVYRVDRKTGEDWPEEPGRIIMNYWSGTEDAEGWMGKFSEDYSGSAQYEYCATSAKPCDDPATTKPGSEPSPLPDDSGDIPTTGWEDGTFTGFDDWSKGAYAHVIGENDATLELSHSQALGTWTCVGLPVPANYKFDWIKFKVKNNGTETANIGLTVAKTGPKGDGSDDIPAITACVTLPESEIAYLTSAKQCVVNLPVGETAEVVLKLNSEIAADKLVIFLNSLGGVNDTLGTTGDVLFSDVAFIMSGERDSGDEQQGDTESVGAEWVAVDLSGMTGWDDRLAISATAASATLSHTVCFGGNYASAAVTPAKFAQGDTVKVKVVNNGDGEAHVKVAVQYNSGSAQTPLVLTAKYAIVTDGTPGEYITVEGDVSWGPVITLAAGQTVIVEVTYNRTGNPNELAFALNSQKGDETVSGNVTVSEAYFKDSKAPVEND